MHSVASIRPPVHLSITTLTSAAKSNNHHYQSKVIVCVCGRSAFNINVKLLLHVFSGEIMKQYNCLLCNREYKYASGLKRHISSKHLNERPFQCSYCDYSSTRKCILEQHEMRHTGERPHVCGLCGKGYIHEGALNSHINKEHLGIPSYTCHFCKEGFSNTASLESHVIRKHEPEKLLKCPGSDCSYVCVWKCHLISHIKRRHANKTEMIDFVNSLQTVRHFAPRTRSKVPSDNAQTMERVSSEQISSKSDELMIISDSDDLIPDHSATPDPKNCSMTKSDKGSNNSESNKNDISRSGSDETDGEKNLEPEVQKHSYQISPQLESPNLESATKSGKLSAEAIEAHHPRSDRKEYESVAITKAKKSRKYQKDSGDMEASKKEKANENGNPGHGVRDSVESMEVQLMNVDKVNAKSEVHLQDALEKIQVSSEQSKTDSDVEIISAESTTVTDSEKDKVIWCTFDSKSLNSEELPTMVDETKLSIEEPKDSGNVDSDRSESMTSKNEKLIESPKESKENNVKTGKGYSATEPAPQTSTSDAGSHRRYRIMMHPKESNDVERKKVKKKEGNEHRKLKPSKQQKQIESRSKQLSNVEHVDEHGKSDAGTCRRYRIMTDQNESNVVKATKDKKRDEKENRSLNPCELQKQRENKPKQLNNMEHGHVDEHCSDKAEDKKSQDKGHKSNQNVCKLCAKTLKRKSRLMKHIEKRHPKQYQEVNAVINKRHLSASGEKGSETVKIKTKKHKEEHFDKTHLLVSGEKDSAAVKRKKKEIERKEHVDLDPSKRHLSASGEKGSETVQRKKKRHRKEHFDKTHLLASGEKDSAAVKRKKKKHRKDHVDNTHLSVIGGKDSAALKRKKREHKKECVHLDPSKQQKLSTKSVKDKKEHTRSGQLISKSKVRKEHVDNTHLSVIGEAVKIKKREHRKEHDDLDPSKRQKLSTKSVKDKNEHSGQLISKSKVRTNRNVCEICVKKYKSIKKLMKHKQKRHSTKSQSGALGEDNKRKKKHHSSHSKKAREDVVDKKKKKREKREENIDKASNECSICKKLFHSAKHVAWHKLTHATTPHKCHSCTATFQTKYHLREHKIKKHGCRDTLLSDYDVFNCSHSPKCANVKICFDKLLLSWKNPAV